ncbi:hypothetical protein Ahy_B07g086504 [Arachis hypogaea]|uniref:Protein FAR1-RELATED SEQUENCE n=1 Tax=Arachis hypogaea TaxID=3818 RepID=A0A444YA42_ARAHY|nr:hypothetical protein Ahy_B07g086504 [Arachis hypogaea]
MNLDVGVWIISKVVLHHSYPCCPDQAQMLKQHGELSISVHRTIENNKEAAAEGHRELNFIEKDARNYITREVRNILGKLNGYKGHLEIEQEMNLVVWNSHTKESFYRNWNDFLLKFGLVDNKWLSGNGAKRERIGCYRFSHRHTVCNKILHRSSVSICVHSLKVQGSPSIIQRKEKLLINFALGYLVYEVGEQVSDSTLNKFVVTYDSVAAQVKFQCLLFESRRILCRHALMSPRYILERWSKNVKRRHTHIKSSHDEPLLEPKSKRFDELVFHSQNICEFASESEELTAILHRAYDNVVVEMEELKAKRKGSSSLSHEDANLESVNELQSPPRIGSKLDKQIANASKKKKTKAPSELKLFDSASVVQ